MEKIQYREVPVPVEVTVERVFERIILKEVPIEKVGLLSVTALIIIQVLLGCECVWSGSACHALAC